jgi:GNAT superfamily N-acetyltransferase
MIRPLSSADYQQWLGLWNQYLVFYKHTLPLTQTELTFSRLTASESDLHGIVLEEQGTLLGIAHFSYTSSTWEKNKDLYLEDLFVDPASRGKGYGRELIEAVAEVGKENNASRLYWQTHRDNATAQKLYETLASKSEFVIYEKKL